MIENNDTLQCIEICIQNIMHIPQNTFWLLITVNDHHSILCINLRTSKLDRLRCIQQQSSGAPLFNLFLNDLFYILPNVEKDVLMHYNFHYKNESFPDRM